MSGIETLAPPVQVTLLTAGRIEQEFVARQVSDLRVRIELLTGIVWLELLPCYQEFVASGKESFRTRERVCHSYEKWGDWQQEVREVEVRLQWIAPEGGVS